MATNKNLEGWTAEISTRDFQSSVLDSDGETIAFELSANQARMKV